MADFTALKQSIAAAIRANGEGAITGPVLQDQLLDMVDAMEVDTFGGFLTADTVPPTDTTVPHLFIGYGEFTNEAFQIGVQRGEVWIVCRMADEDEWTKVNLTSNLLNRIQALEEGTQIALTPGDGISIDAEGNISTKAGNGLTYDNEGNLIVDTETVATNASVAEYVSGQKNIANGIAGLDAEGKVESENLPDDIAYFEEGVDPTSEEYQDEYQRILEQLYQNIADVEAALFEVRKATQDATHAINDTEAATRDALSAKQQALNAAGEANTAAELANTKAGLAAQAASDATGAASGASSAASAANLAANYANQYGTAANNAANLANDKATFANTEGTYAKNQGDYAKEQGDYAKAEGDIAKDIVDAAKGDYDTLNDRLNALEETANSAYQKPENGIPSTDMTDEVQASLGLADTAVQPEDLATVATTGSYTDLSNTPTALSDFTDDLDGVAVVDGVDFSQIFG